MSQLPPYPYIIQQYSTVTYATQSMPNGYIYIHPIEIEQTIYQISATQTYTYTNNS